MVFIDVVGALSHKYFDKKKNERKSLAIRAEKMVIVWQNKTKQMENLFIIFIGFD